MGKIFRGRMQPVETGPLQAFSVADGQEKEAVRKVPTFWTAFYLFYHHSLSFSIKKTLKISKI